MCATSSCVCLRVRQSLEEEKKRRIIAESSLDRLRAEVNSKLAVLEEAVPLAPEKRALSLAALPSGPLWVRDFRDPVHRA